MHLGVLMESGSETLGLPTSEWEGWFNDFLEHLAPKLNEAQRHQLFANARHFANVDHVPDVPGSYLICKEGHERLNNFGIFSLAAGGVPLWRVAALRENNKSPNFYYPDNVAASLGQKFTNLVMHIYHSSICSTCRLPDVEHFMHPACFIAAIGAQENLPIRLRVVDPSLFVNISIHNIHKMFRDHRPNSAIILPRELRGTRTPAGLHAGELDHAAWVSIRHSFRGFFPNFDWADVERKLVKEFADPDSELFRIRTTLDWHDRLMNNGYRNEYDSLSNWALVSRRSQSRQGFVTFTMPLICLQQFINLIVNLTRALKRYCNIFVPP
jgi:hypothetical protein